MVLSKQLKLKINAIDIRIHFNSKEKQKRLCYIYAGLSLPINPLSMLR